MAVSTPTPSQCRSTSTSTTRRSPPQNRLSNPNVTAATEGAPGRAASVELAHARGACPAVAGGRSRYADPSFLLARRLWRAVEHAYRLWNRLDRTWSNPCSRRTWPLWMSAQAWAMKSRVSAGSSAGSETSSVHLCGSRLRGTPVPIGGGERRCPRGVPATCGTPCLPGSTGLGAG